MDLSQMKFFTVKSLVVVTFNELLESLETRKNEMDKELGVVHFTEPAYMQRIKYNNLHTALSELGRLINEYGEE